MTSTSSITFVVLACVAVAGFFPHRAAAEESTSCPSGTKQDGSTYPQGSRKNLVCTDPDGAIRRLFEWYPSGQLHVDRRTDPVAGGRSDSVREYLADGTLARKVDLLNGRGTETQFHPNGAIYAQGSVVGFWKLSTTARWGTWTFSSTDGTKTDEAQYADPSYDGPCFMAPLLSLKSWYPDGKLSKTDTWNGCTRNGLLREWYPNGQLAREQNYRNGKAEEPAQLWAPDGTALVTMTKDEKTGLVLCTIRYPSLDLREQGSYRDGNKADHWRQWYEGGQLRSEGDYSSGLKTGPWTTWYENGQTESEAFYSQGQLDGLRKEWWSDGTPSFRGRYKKDFPVGQHDRWSHLGALVEANCYAATGTLAWWTTDDDEAVKRACP